jgi:hypothetical protein
MSDPAEEQISHSEEDHGFGDVEALLVIADQPALCISSRLAFPTSSAGLLDAANTLQPKETGHLDHPGSSHRWSSTPTLMRAVSFASAMAACFVAVRASNCTSHGRRAPLRSACRITAMAPTTSIWRRYRLPALVMPPGRTLLPEEFAIVTSRCRTLPIAWTKANGHQKVTTSPRETDSLCSSQKFTRPNGA